MIINDNIETVKHILHWKQGKVMATCSVNSLPHSTSKFRLRSTPAQL